MRLAALVLLLATPVFAAAPDADDDVVVGSARCHRPIENVVWSVQGEVPLRVVVGALADLTCHRYFVPRPLLETPVRVDLGSESLRASEIAERVSGALRAQGIVLDLVLSYRASRAGDTSNAYLPPSPPSPPQPRRYIAPELLDASIACAGNKCTITRALFDAFIADTSAFTSDARFIPAIVDGKTAGFKIYAIRLGSFFSRVGLQNGDTIASINGTDISTPDRMLELYARIRTAKTLVIGVERRGKPLTLTWVIVEGTKAKGK